MCWPAIPTGLSSPHDVSLRFRFLTCFSYCAAFFFPSWFGLLYSFLLFSFFLQSFVLFSLTQIIAPYLCCIWPVQSELGFCSILIGLVQLPEKCLRWKLCYEYAKSSYLLDLAPVCRLFCHLASVKIMSTCFVCVVTLFRWRFTVGRFYYDHSWQQTAAFCCCVFTVGVYYVSYIYINTDACMQLEKQSETADLRQCHVVSHYHTWHIGSGFPYLQEPRVSWALAQISGSPPKLNHL